MNPIKFYKSFSYSKRVPTLVSINTSGHTEIAKWVLDINQIQYIEKNYPPVIGERKAGRIINSQEVNNMPVYLQTDRLIYSSESIIHDFDANLPEGKQLFPSDIDLQNEVYELYKLFTTTFYTAVERYRYSELFKSKKECTYTTKKEYYFPESIKIQIKLW